jgi:hypothetical protein
MIVMRHFVPLGIVVVLVFFGAWLSFNQRSNAALNGPLWMRPLIALHAPTEALCSADFSIFNSKVYFGAAPVTEADEKTFLELPTSNCITYGKDRNHVYVGYLGHSGATYEIIEGADPTTFFPLYDAEGLIPYSMDRKNVFTVAPLMYGIQSAADTADTNVAGANPRTFETLYDAEGYFTGYSKDESHVYYYTDPNPMQAADSSSFVVKEGIWSWLFPGAHTIIGLGYGLDNKAVYYGQSVVADANPATFSTITTQAGFWTPYAKDKNHVYCEVKAGGYYHLSILTANAATFRPEADSSGAFNGIAADQQSQWKDCTEISSG